MSLFDRLKSDNQRILGDDMQDVTLYNAAGQSLAGKARVTSPGMDVSMQGQAFASKKNTIGFHIDNFTSLMTTNENFKNWKASFLNSQGETVTGIFNNPLIDKTFGYVVATLTELKAAI
jgi:hypothetical protein